MTNDIICFSHLRWNFVYQRPQHLISRFGKNSNVFFIKEPIFDAPLSCYDLARHPGTNVWIFTLHMEPNLTSDQILIRQRDFVDIIIETFNIKNYVLWYYAPMAIEYTRHLAADVVVYDCMDELSAFKFANPQLAHQEERLLRIADVVFTGGRSLYEAKSPRHLNVHLFPSSIDKEHFKEAREFSVDPLDQWEIPHPRIGFYGVLDERIDFELISEAADIAKEWHFIFVGPVTKIDPAALPKKKNIHYLGQKDYSHLPAYLSGWDIAMMPFAINDATRFISPTKTPEYLCAGKEVISTPVADVVADYGDTGFVHIATTAAEFVDKAEQILNLSEYERNFRIKKVDEYLEGMSWDNTWRKMNKLIEDVMENNNIIKIN